MRNPPGENWTTDLGDFPPWPASPLFEGAVTIARHLGEAGFDAFFVGGCVRNWLLGAPIADIDLATSAAPAEIEKIFGHAKSVGAHFGVSLVNQGGETYEVATFRSESGYIDKRRPSEVRFGALEDDWKRRDFTVNALYYDPAGRIFDPSGGLDDLKQGILRAVGSPEKRFEEDALRLMRAVRFAVRYELTIEPESAAAIREHADGLKEISIERIAGELLKILTGPHPGKAMTLMGELGLWPYVIPEIEAMKGVRQPANYHPEGDVFVHTALVLEKLAENRQEGEMPEALALGALLHDVGKPPTFSDDGERIRFSEHQRIGEAMTHQIGRRLRLPLKTIDQAASLVGQHMRFMDAAKMKRSTLRRFLGQPDFDWHLELHRADCLGSHGQLDNYDFCIEQRKELEAAAGGEAILPAPLVNGGDLIAMGMRPGIELGAVLKEIREMQLEGELGSREAALEWARRKLEGCAGGRGEI